MTPMDAELICWVVAAAASLCAVALTQIELRAMSEAHAREVNVLQRQLRTAQRIADEVMHLRVTGVIAKRG